MTAEGFNALSINDGSFAGKQLESVLAAGPFKSDVELVFDAIADRVRREILAHDWVLACMAWVSDRGIIDALSRIRGASIVVAKERYLRLGDAESRVDLRRLYAAVKPIMPDHDEAFRCVGEVRRREDLRGILHHKFAVLMRDGATPTRVLAGSYNWTATSRKNRELLMVIESSPIAAALCEEHHRMLCLAEPLDWTGEFPGNGNKQSEVSF